MYLLAVCHQFRFSSHFSRINAVLPLAQHSRLGTLLFRTMDWTAVFEEDGNEDLIIPQLIEQRERKGAPRLARLVSRRYHHHHPHHRNSEGTDDGGLQPEQASVAAGSSTAGRSSTVLTATSTKVSGDHRLLELSSYYETADEDDGGNGSGYTLRSMYFLSINYILGVGILGIPYSFARAGFLLCLGLLVIVTLFSYWTVMWVAESGVRYQHIVQQRGRGENEPLMDNGEGEGSEEEALSRSATRYEVIDLVDFFLGKFQKGIYQVALLALMYVGLVSTYLYFSNMVRQYQPI